MSKDPNFTLYDILSPTDARRFQDYLHENKSVTLTQTRRQEQPERDHVIVSSKGSKRRIRVQLATIYYLSINDLSINSFIFISYLLQNHITAALNSVATKMLKDFDTFQTALPLKEIFFLLKANVLCTMVDKMVAVYVTCY